MSMPMMMFMAVVFVVMCHSSFATQVTLSILIQLLKFMNICSDIKWFYSIVYTEGD